MAVRGPHNRKSIAKATWLTTAVRLSNEGKSIRAIATKVGKSPTTVWEALQAEFERVRPQEAELAALRNVQRGQLHRQLEAWIPRSLKGEKDAALAVSRFLDRAAKLDGLDAPTRNEHTGKNGAPISSVVFDMSKLSDEQVDRFLVAGDVSLLGGDPPVTPLPSEG